MEFHPTLFLRSAFLKKEKKSRYFAFFALFFTWLIVSLKRTRMNGHNVWMIESWFTMTTEPLKLDYYNMIEK